MAKTDKQKAADAALSRALERVVVAYDMMPPEPDVLDYLLVYQQVANGILNGAFDYAREALDGKAEAGPESGEVR